MNEYIPILVLGGLALAFALFSVGIAPFTGPARYNRAKMDRYESGIEPSPLPEGGGKVSIKYFFTAMMFIVFDIEIVFLYPWAVSFNQMSLFPVLAMILFVLTVFIPYFYVLRRGGLDWD